MKSLKILFSLTMLILVAAACSKSSDPTSANFIGDWKVAQSTVITANGKQVDSYKFNFSLKFNEDGTCYRTQPIGTDTLFWALQLKQNVLVLASNNPRNNLSGYRMNIIKNEPAGHKWVNTIYTTYPIDTAWVPAIFEDTYDLTPK
jgi:hypothetical protein